MKKVLFIFLALLMIGCNTTDNSSNVDHNVNNTDTSDMFTKRDYETSYDESISTIIQLNKSSISCNDDSVDISSTTVTITKEGTYILKGVLDDGMVIVDSDKNAKIYIILDSADITSTTSSPIYIKQADKVFFTLVNDNALSNGGTFKAIDDNNIDAVIFSKDDITLNGDGKLTINSPSGHGIVSKDDIVFTGGVYIINSSSHGITANNSVRIDNANLKISSGKDGIQSQHDEDTQLGFIYIEKGVFDIVSEGDGISASGYILIQDGQYDIITGGGYKNGTKTTSDNWGGFMGGRGPGMHGGMNSNNEISNEDSESIKGIKAGSDLTIKSGTFCMDCADDTVHSNNSILINGGTMTLSSGDDGIHADNNLTIKEGNIEILESYEGLEGLTIDIKGGDIDLKASDDGLNSNGGSSQGGMGGPRGQDHFSSDTDAESYIQISGGKLYVNASGDGIDANGYIDITNGYIVVVGPTTGDTATLDYDISATISGGTFIGTGARGMAQVFSDSSTQGVFAVTANADANTKVVLEDTSGKEIISYSPELSYQVIILSNPDIKKGESYTITVGEQSGTFTAY